MAFALFQIASQDFTASEARELSPVERRARRIERGLNNIINRWVSNRQPYK
jgi:small conductance mechanosensitive channel